MRRISKSFLVLFIVFAFISSLHSSFAGVYIGPNEDSLNSDTFSKLYEKSRDQVVLVIAVGAGWGSGFIWTSDGYVITNAHVVEGAKTVEVYIDDRQHYTAKIIGSDLELDVAVLKIDTDLNLTAAAIGNSDQVKIGDWIYAIGAPMGFKYSLSVGVVGGLRRSMIFGSGIQELIQLDIDLNPGSSGGPIYNLRGEVTGISVGKIKEGNIGFAIPVNDVIFVAGELLKNGKVKYSRLGISLRELAEVINEDVAKKWNIAWPLPQKQGIIIVSVEPDSPASKANLQQGDIIVSFNNKPAGDLSRFSREVAFSQPGVEIPLVVRRAGVEINLQVKLEERPATRRSKKEEEKDDPSVVPTPTPTPAPEPTPDPISNGNEIKFGKSLDFFSTPVTRAIREYQGLLSEISVGMDQQVRVRSTNAFAVDGLHVVTVSSFLNPDAYYASLAKYVFNGIPAKLAHVSTWGAAIFELASPYSKYKTPIVWSNDTRIGGAYSSLVIKNPANGDSVPYISLLLNQVGQALIFNAVMKKIGLGAPIFNTKGEVVGMWFVPDKDPKDPEDIYDSTVAIPASMIKKVVEAAVGQQDKK